MLIEQGQTIYRTHGEYSTYSVTGFYRALRSFDSDVLLKEFAELGTWPKKSSVWPKGHWWGADDEFMAWLVSELYLESCDEEFIEVWCDSGTGGKGIVFAKG